ncbi:TonB-dependent receptor [Pontibacter sp. HSC-14F20]|uniref:SusC/RagA family TonB-linked outer membrane protein n=1 Tax=Pontibacter sp. HSC-14F20 TaxID=2864136 RepID=UPI001C73731E|nr:TonB-dependent receptor [Pontibacter sp. HSC-14F20]MBX0333281.1 TonB-dependent receptor [Pontibacter sp. HSC-14F20]
MKKSILLSFFLVLALVGSVWAQTQTVTGRVTAANDGSALPGVTVLERGTSNGVTTGIDGDYTLTVQPSATLVFSFIGMQRQEIPVNGRSTIDVQLAADERQLSEVVVVGYGTQERREVTGATAKVKSEDIQNLPVVGVDQALQGRAAGVQISQNSGTPGGGITVRVRGATSISASNQPLYVVDGVPLTTGDFSQLGFGGQSVNAVTDINPNDIESIDILKDASAAAIYGSRAANGVVLITTKRGSARQTQVNFNMYAGTQKYWKKPKLLNAQQYTDIMMEAFVNDGFIPEGQYTPQDFVDFYYNGVDFPVADTDWVDEISRTAGISNYEISLSGGDPKTRYYVSGNYFDQKGVVISSRYQRYSTRLNLDHQANDRFSLGTSIQLSRSDSDRIISDNSITSPFANALAASPLWPVYEDPEATTYSYPNFFYTNPVAEGRENDNVTRNLRAVGNAFAKYAIIPGLDLQVKGGVDVLNVDERRYSAANFEGATFREQGGQAINATTTVSKRLLEATLAYNKVFNEIHSLSSVIGTSKEDNQIRSTSVTGEGFASDRFRYVSSAARVNAGTGAELESSLVSFFGRVNYSFRDRYLLGVNFRADGSSRFGENNRYGYFPSVSAGWRLIEEDFMSGLDYMSELKLRASYGVTGNQEIGDFQYLALYTGGSNYLDLSGLAQSQLANPDLKWETTKQFNVGTDIGFFNGRVNLALDYYVKKTDDLLFARPIPTQSGFSSVQFNVGSTENKGFEIALNTVNISNPGNGFNWTTDFNIARNRNKVTSLYEGQDIFYGFGGNSIVLREGYPIGTFYGLIADGIYSRQDEVPASKTEFNGTLAGDVNYRDINEDGIITDDDFTVIGNAQPDFIGGLTNTLRYGGFDLNVFFQFSSGNDIAMPSREYQMHLGRYDDNMVEDVLGRWQQEGDVTDVPRATYFDENYNGRSNSSRFIYDGSYLRLKNLVLGYTLPSAISERLKMRTLRVYAQAQNLVTFTDYPGFDPEVNFAGTSNTTLGVDFYTVPQSRTITFGVNVGF